MRKLVFILVFGILSSCKKENSRTFNATVLHEIGCAADSRLVMIENFSFRKPSFLCEDQPQLSAWNCSNTVFIKNLPAELSITGKKIQFARWKDFGLDCASYSLAPRNIEVYDAKAR